MFLSMNAGNKMEFLMVVKFRILNPVYCRNESKAL